MRAILAIAALSLMAPTGRACDYGYAAQLPAYGYAPAYGAAYGAVGVAAYGVATVPYAYAPPVYAMPVVGYGAVGVSGGYVGGGYVGDGYEDVGINPLLGVGYGRRTFIRERTVFRRGAFIDRGLGFRSTTIIRRGLFGRRSVTIIR